MTAISSQEKLTKAALFRALDRFDAAWGKPFEAKPVQTRVEAFIPAMKGIPTDAIEWAVDAALATLDRHPFPVQLKRLAQASPVYTKLMEARHTHDEKTQTVCGQCNERRAWWRIQILGMPRPLVGRVIRHREDCSTQDALDQRDASFVDAPRWGVELDRETWEQDPEASRIVSDAPTPTPTVNAILAQEQRRRDFKSLAAGEV